MAIDFTAEVEKRKDDLFEDLNNLLRVNSVEDKEHADAENPFGPGPRKALDTFLGIAERDGFETYNCDNYAGHIEYSNGAADDAEVIGIIGHLDVVPAGAGWDSDPFEPEVRDGNLYARGTSDDKGPTVSAYYALKILKELNVPLSKKIRFIVGTNEETGWGDMDYYFKHCDLPEPDLGFSPDAYFPIINGEKGNVTFYLHFDGKNAGEVVLHSFNAGLAENMVPEAATAVISGVSDLQAKLEAFVAGNSEKELRFELEEADGKATITMHGKAAHGSTPEHGVNAATYLALFLNEFSFADGAAAYIKLAAETLLEDHQGDKLGTAYTDELMGFTSMNAGVWSFDENGEGKIALNFRYPKGNSPEKIEAALVKLAGVTEVTKGAHAQGPHYVPMSDPLVSTLLKVYEKYTGKPGREVIIGGGTFGRLMERGVAFGALFEDEPDTMHQANEFKPVDLILKSAVIFAEAIYELAK